MPTATLRINARQKARLDRLQAAVSLWTGRRVARAELLDWLLERGEAAPEALAGVAWRPLSEAEIGRVMSLPMDFGFEIGDVDEGVYGKKKRARS